MVETSTSNKLVTELAKGFYNSEYSDSITVKRAASFSAHQQLSISFQRTVRVSDNKKVNNLPPGLGAFPVYATADYKQTLPESMSGKEGYFIPMYQREAMWIRFQSNTPFALKIYVGGVNAVSGEPARETEVTMLRRLKLMQKRKSVQDYVVTPQQLWLDGIASSDGKVRQFVAMPLGEGYTVEAQITGYRFSDWPAADELFFCCSAGSITTPSRPSSPSATSAPFFTVPIAPLDFCGCTDGG